MKINTILAVMCAASCALADIEVAERMATAPSGTANIAFGYGAGYQSGGTNVNVVAIGTDAARGSDSNTNAVFIGANAGLNVSGKSKYTDVNGHFKGEGNGVISVNAGGATVNGANVLTGNSVVTSFNGQTGAVTYTPPATVSVTNDEDRVSYLVIGSQSTALIMPDESAEFRGQAWKATNADIAENAGTAIRATELDYDGNANAKIYFNTQSQSGQWIVKDTISSEGVVLHTGNCNRTVVSGTTATVYDGNGTAIGIFYLVSAQDANTYYRITVNGTEARLIPMDGSSSQQYTFTVSEYH